MGAVVLHESGSSAGQARGWPGYIEDPIRSRCTPRPTMTVLASTKANLAGAHAIMPSDRLSLTSASDSSTYHKYKAISTITSCSLKVRTAHRARTTCAFGTQLQFIGEGSLTMPTPSKSTMSLAMGAGRHCGSPCYPTPSCRQHASTTLISELTLGVGHGLQHLYYQQRIDLSHAV